MTEQVCCRGMRKYTAIWLPWMKLRLRNRISKLNKNGWSNGSLYNRALICYQSDQWTPRCHATLMCHKSRGMCHDKHRFTAKPTLLHFIATDVMLDKDRNLTFGVHRYCVKIDRVTFIIHFIFYNNPRIIHIKMTWKILSNQFIAWTAKHSTSDL